MAETANQTTTALLCDALRVLTIADEQNDIVNALKDMANKIILADAFTIDDLFVAILGQVANMPRGTTGQQFTNTVKQLMHVFDANGDGYVTKADFLLFKVQPYETILRSLAKIILVLNKMDKTMFKIKLDRDALIDISYRIIIYGIFTPIVTKDKEFRDFIVSPDGAMLMGEILSYVKTVLQSSQMVGQAVDGAIKLLSSGCGGCCSAKTQVAIDTAIKDSSIELERAKATSELLSKMNNQ